MLQQCHCVSQQGNKGERPGMSPVAPCRSLSCPSHPPTGFWQRKTRSPRLFSRAPVRVRDAASREKQCVPVGLGEGLGYCTAAGALIAKVGSGGQAAGVGLVRLVWLASVWRSAWSWPGVGLGSERWGSTVPSGVSRGCTCTQLLEPVSSYFRTPMAASRSKELESHWLRAADGRGWARKAERAAGKLQETAPV